MTKDQNISGFAELQPGTPLCNGKYIIKEKVGEGGFGITYQALQCDLDRLVCIKEYFLSGKCIREECSNTIYPQGDKSHLFEKFRQSFVQEAKMVAALHHPNIVEVIDIFDENNTSYMVMPFIEGKTLRNIVNSRGRLPYPETVNYIAQITSAVGYLHEQNILHRDIKPDNIMITEDFKAILIDFGSAREFVHDKTQAQTSMWTDGYAPPEQYTSNSRKGSYTDIYAIGATLYFALTGQVPMESAARLTERMPAPRDLVPEIPEEANRTILKAMQLKTENRHQSVQEFMDDLRNIRPSVLIDEKNEAIDEFFNTLENRKILKGKVKTFKNYGVFVDLGLVDGLIHISELSWEKIKDPSEILKIGDEIEVSVKNFDKESRKISLRYKKDEDNPWEKLKNDYPIGSTVEAKIVGLTDYGAFANILPGVDGLIHVSQISNKRINKPQDVLSIGDKVDVMIKDIDFEKHRISLSIKDLLSENKSENSSETNKMKENNDVSEKKEE